MLFLFAYLFDFFTNIVISAKTISLGYTHFIHLLLLLLFFFTKTSIFYKFILLFCWNILGLPEKYRDWHTEYLCVHDPSNKTLER